VSGALQLAVDCRREERTAVSMSNRTVLPLHTEWERRTFQIACSEQIYRANVFRMGSSNSSCAAKSCTCASITFQAGIISLSVDYKCYSLQNRHNQNYGSNTHHFLTGTNAKHFFPHYYEQLTLKHMTET